ncbi:MAG: TetR/AcrR family transcriptional regulator [Pseudolysinimonas sp.]
MTLLGLTADPVRPGRKRDLTRDPEILAATLEVLAEEGYDGMTVDMVAARAKAGKATLYRRWPSKAELVIDAVACMKNAGLDPENLPDTGSLRGDLIAMIKPHSMEDGERKLHIMAGIVSMISRSPELATVAHQAFVAPRAAITRALIQRAVDRGEVSAEHDLETAAMVAPAMTAYRVLMLRQPVTRDFMVSVIDNVILPALGVKPAPSSA